MENELMPFLFKFNPTNREQRRAMMNEIKRNVPKTDEIEKRFLRVVFDDDDTHSYEYIYHQYLEMYEMAERWLKKNRKLKYTILTPNYFSRKYGYDEKVDGVNIYKSLRKILDGKGSK